MHSTYILVGCIHRTATRGCNDKYKQCNHTPTFIQRFFFLGKCHFSYCLCGRFYLYRCKNDTTTKLKCPDNHHRRQKKKTKKITNNRKAIVFPLVFFSCFGANHYHWCEGIFLTMSIWKCNSCILLHLMCAKCHNKSNKLCADR